MHLSKLELTGFKSFAKKTTLTFPRLEIGKSNITAVVGPNGSGKSNIADAIRWVTGEQSLKTLRGKKSEDVIFSGTSKSARLGVALVSLYLDNTDQRANIGYSELILTRKIYRNGESDYLINGSKTRLIDILMLAAKLSFGQKSYSIIGQGMADAILSASPSERKEFLNEAAGIKQYQLKRDQAVNKLRTTEENLKQAETLITEIKPRLNSLTRQIKRLERKEQKEKELAHLQTKYYGKLWQEINKKWEAEVSELKKTASERSKVETDFHSLQSQLARLARTESRESLFQKFQDEYNEIQNTKNDLLHRKTLLSSKLGVLKNELKTQSQPSNICSLSIDETTDLLGGLEKSQKLEQELIQNLDIGKLENAKSLARKIIESIKELINIIKKDDTQAKQESEIKKGEAKKEIEQLESKFDQLEKELEAQEQKFKRAQEKISGFNQENQKEREELFNLQKQIQGKQDELSKSLSEESEIRVEIARIETKKEDLENEIEQELRDLEKVKNTCIDSSLNTSEVYPKIQNLKHQLELIGGIDEEVAKEYKETKERFEFLSSQTSDLKKASHSLGKLIKELEKIIKDRFNQSFDKVNTEFQKFFKTLFQGGHAKLTYTQEIISQPQPEDVNDNLKLSPARLATPASIAEQSSAGWQGVAGRQMSSPPAMPSKAWRAGNNSNLRNSGSLEKIRGRTQSIPTDPDDGKDPVIKEGVEIEATPPGKRLKSINMLSGGEKALTSIALICAIIASNPSPFVILDEVDAALDEANSVRFADILEQLSHKTQFIVITHNRATMEKAKILYGVTMGDDGISRMLSVKLEEVK